MLDYLSEIYFINTKINKNCVSTQSGILAHQALIKEILLTPKPGLVDINNSGAHGDMDIYTFVESINAIAPWLDEFYIAGLKNHNLEAALFLTELRAIGMKCEASMFKATCNINTHKGGIFAFALLLSAVGRLEGRGLKPTANQICHEVSLMCSGLVDKELKHISHKTPTSGEKIYAKYGFPGARGEAESGYKTVRNISLPVYFALNKKKLPETQVLLEVLLHLLANNSDSNLVARGGIDGLNYVKRKSMNLINLNINNQDQLIIEMKRLDEQLINSNLSPGGSADLLAVTLFLAEYSPI